jgi:hypothetical protein
VEYTPPSDYYGTVTFYYTASSSPVNPVYWTYKVTINLTHPAPPGGGGSFPNKPVL